MPTHAGSRQSTCTAAGKSSLDCSFLRLSSCGASLSAGPDRPRSSDSAIGQAQPSPAYRQGTRSAFCAYMPATWEASSAHVVMHSLQARWMPQTVARADAGRQQILHMAREKKVG